MQETEVSVQSADAVLAGTLCLPPGDSPRPAVLMLPASGPIDRDENIEGQRLDLFNTVAHHLAPRGIASLRYDKRGCGQSTGVYFKAGYFDFVADAIACFDALQHHPGIQRDRVFALGHSEGAVTAMHVNVERSSLAGIIQLCPTAENFDTALLKQARHLRAVLGELPDASDPVALQQRLIDRVRADEASSEEVEAYGIGLRWLRDVLSLDIPSLYQQVRVPMLLIAGSKDLQCDPAPVPDLKNAVPALIDIHLVPDLTHILRYEDQQPSILRYAELLQMPVAMDVLTLISNWLQRQFTASCAAVRPAP